MDYDQLQFEFKHAASIRLIRSEHAPLILSFLHLQFKETQRITVPYAELLEKLDIYMEMLSELHSKYFPRPAQEYLKQWCDEEHQFLRVYVRGNSDDPTVELAPAAEQALSWITDLQQRSFIGTESRFLHIFSLLEEIVTRSSEDGEARLAQLEQQKTDIQREIDLIHATGQVERYSATQIRERFIQAGEVARQLLRDFSAVEQNFRSIAHSVQKAQLQPDARKGAVVSSVLDADNEMKESDEGRSFYAFWEFLMSPSKQDQLRELLQGLDRIPELQELARDNRILRTLTRNLLDAGEKIVESNHRLAEQLRRMLDERNISERRRVRELIAEIKHLAFQRLDDPPEDAMFFDLEGLPVVDLVMEKGLWEPRVSVSLSAQPIPDDGAVLSDQDLAALYSQFVVDESRLRRRIDMLLEEQPELSLGALVAAYPVEQGLAEVIAYLSVASRDSRHTIDAKQTEQISLFSHDNGSQSVLLNIPLVIFRRNNAR